MKYKDLIQFDPIETVIQLESANNATLAHSLVRSYVVSDQMAERIADLAVPNLQFDEPSDNKALLVVGNYGTGKSHLLSVISSIAEDDTFVADLRHDQLRDKLKPVSGRFKVCRLEIGATTMSLHDIVCGAISVHLASIGISFKFPELSEASNNKDSFEDMMAVFEKSYPEQGYLLVVDELLDFLRSRKDHELILDLNFLREIGEVCRNLRFRFIGGVQEAIFETERFSFAADDLRRVKDRFEQVIIARNDIEFVVKERLLRKTVDQQQLIRTHLQKFSKFFGSMNEHMDDFVRLFPVHPDYIETFERIRFMEKRQVLKTLSLQIRALLEQDVPEDQPGIIAFDSYWVDIRGDASFRGIPSVRQVIDTSERIEGRIKLSSMNAIYKDNALRIIYALSVERLTTGDVNTPIGITSQEMLDRLCLFNRYVVELGGKAPDKDLLTHIDTVLREIIKVVNGQFISYNPSNGQYYLDLKKNEDFDENIKSKADSLDNDTYDRYYYQVLRFSMECQSIQTAVQSYLIWQYELPWIDRKTTRLGYLFFGAPNERSTAVPQREFYLYFLQPFDPPSFKDEKKADEIFFRLKKPDETFVENLKLFAGAKELALTASGQSQGIYNQKAEEYRTRVHEWLSKDVDSAFEVTYRGQSKKINEWGKDKPIRDLAGIGANETINFRDYINTIAALCFAPYFEEKAPEYPHFSVKITQKNLILAVQEAINAVATQTFSRHSRAILEAFNLIKNDHIDTSKSQYTQYILDKFKDKAPGQVINRDEIITKDHDVEYMAPSRFRLEPEWVAVLLASLVYTGQIVLVLGTQKFDAANLRDLSTISIEDLVKFKHIEPPKEWNQPGLQALMQLLKMSPGNVNLIIDGKPEPIRQMQDRLSEVTKRLAQAKTVIDKGIDFWGEDLIKKEEFVPLRERIKETQAFLDLLQAFNTTGKLKNFRYTPEEVTQHEQVLTALAALESLQGIINQQNNTITYLCQATGILPADHTWQKEYNDERQSILLAYRTLSVEEIRQSREFDRRLADLKNKYKEAYIELHIKNRLGQAEEEKKKSLLNDARFHAIQKLSGIELLQNSQVHQWTETLNRLKSCSNLTPDQLDRNPMCPNCGFRPSTEGDIGNSAKQQLKGLDENLDTILEALKGTLFSNLEDPLIKTNLELLKPEERVIIDQLLQSRELPDTIESSFVNAVQNAFSSLIRVPLHFSDFTSALKLNEGTTTVDELRQRFEDFLREITKGKDPNKVRIVME